MSLRTLVECSDSGRFGAVAEIWRRSDLDDGAIGSRSLGTEEATKSRSRGSSCVGDAIGSIGGDVVAISWSLSRKLIIASVSGANLPPHLDPALAHEAGFHAKWVQR